MPLFCVSQLTRQSGIMCIILTSCSVGHRIRVDGVLCRRNRDESRNGGQDAVRTHGGGIDDFPRTFIEGTLLLLLAAVPFFAIRRHAASCRLNPGFIPTLIPVRCTPRKEALTFLSGRMQRE